LASQEYIMYTELKNSSNVVLQSTTLDSPLYRTHTKWDSPHPIPTVATYIPLEFLNGKKGHSHRERKGHSLFLHKNIIRSRIKENEFTIEFLKDILKRVAANIYNEIKKETQTTGDKYDYYGIKETRGETIGIYIGKKTRQITLQFVTHKLKRLEAYRNLLIDLNIEQVDWTFEIYTRYHHIHETRVTQILNALRKQYGKSQRWEIHNQRGKDVHYLLRVKGIDLNGAEIHIKTYRSKHYNKYSPNHPEHHPKLEQETRLKNISPTFITPETITQYSIILTTVIKATKIKPIIGDYEKQSDSIEAAAYSEKMRRTLRAVNKRIKANSLLEQDIEDIRIAVAKLLVDKKMKQTEIAKALGYSYRHIKRIVEELVDKGIIKRVKRGYYEWVNKKEVIQEEETKIAHKHYDTLEQFLEDLKSIKQPKILQLKPQLVITYKEEEVEYKIITNIYVDNHYTMIKTKDKRVLGYKISPIKLQELILRANHN